MEHSPASRLLIYGIFFSLLVIMAFAFFALTGGSLRPSGNFGVKLVDVLYEATPPEGGRRVAAVSAARDPRTLPPDTLREPAVPETPAEVQYFEAIQKAKFQEERQAARLRPRDEVLHFLETPLGKDFRAVAELARRGRTREAREYLSKLLPAMGDVEPAIQQYALKMALAIYKKEKDNAGAADAIRRYIDISRARLANDRAKLSPAERASAADALRELDDLTAQINKAQSGEKR